MAYLCARLMDEKGKLKKYELAEGTVRELYLYTSFCDDYNSLLRTFSRKDSDDKASGIIKSRLPFGTADSSTFFITYHKGKDAIEYPVLYKGEEEFLYMQVEDFFSYLYRDFIITEADRKNGKISVSQIELFEGIAKIIGDKPAIFNRMFENFREVYDDWDNIEKEHIPNPKKYELIGMNTDNIRSALEYICGKYETKKELYDLLKKIIVEQKKAKGIDASNIRLLMGDLSKRRAKAYEAGDSTTRIRARINSTARKLDEQLEAASSKSKKTITQPNVIDKSEPLPTSSGIELEIEEEISKLRAETRHAMTEELRNCYEFEISALQDRLWKLQIVRAEQVNGSLTAEEIFDNFGIDLDDRYKYIDEHGKGIKY